MCVCICVCMRHTCLCVCVCVYVSRCVCIFHSATGCHAVPGCGGCLSGRRGGVSIDERNNEPRILTSLPPPPPQPQFHRFHRFPTALAWQSRRRIFLWVTCMNQQCWELGKPRKRSVNRHRADWCRNTQSNQWYDLLLNYTAILELRTPVTIALPDRDPQLHISYCE